MLRRLLAGLTEHTDYPSLELIAVDNGSEDNSVELLRQATVPFPLEIVANPHNESFSDACNQGAELACGELLLFINNDVQPFESAWLRELVACLRERTAGAVAATLVCRDEEHEACFRYGYGVQHRGLDLCEQDDGMIHPVLHGWEADPLDERLGVDEERVAVAAACVLVGRDDFEVVGGFTHGYVYGAEDVDLCLKLREAGRPVFCSGRSVAIHHPVSTRRADPFELERARKLANRHVLWERWGPQLRRIYECDRGRPAHAQIRAPGFCLKLADEPAAAEPPPVVTALERLGCRVLVLVGDAAEDAVGLNYDVAVHRAGDVRYVPKPAQLNVLWVGAGASDPDTVERARFDLVLDDEADPTKFAERLYAEALRSLASARVAAR
jgi:GT2 family glycosyltransferase